MHEFSLIYMESHLLSFFPILTMVADLCLEEDAKAEFICPFCADEFDMVGLCCHIDEDHPVEAKNGVNHLHTYVD